MALGWPRLNCAKRAGRVAASQTIVRKVRGGGDPEGHRFVILSETAIDDRGRVFAFTPIGAEMTMAEVTRRPSRAQASSCTF